MEKLESVVLPSKDKKKASQKKEFHKKKKQSKFLQFLNHDGNKVFLITFLLLFSMLTVFSYLIFSKNSYYVYLKKPQILSNGVVVAFLLTLLFMLTYCHLVFSLWNEYKLENLKIEEKNLVEKDAKEQIDSSKNTNENSVQTTQKTKFIDKFKKSKNSENSQKNAKNNQKTRVFYQYFAIFAIFLLLILSFLLKLLWVSAFLSFVIFFVFFRLIFKSKDFYSKIISGVMLAVSICNLFSFYFLYLLN